MLSVEPQNSAAAVVNPFEGELPLSDAFRVFSDAARSLERTYFNLGEEVRRLRRELAEERELRLRREALAQMAALIAHEVRNPLASMELFANLLSSSDLTGEKREWAEQIQSGLRVVSASVNNVLEFHTPSPEKLIRTEISATLKNLHKLVRPVFSQAGMELVLEIAAQPLVVLADQQRLMQVWLNIALNAVRFAAEGGILRVFAFRKEDNVVIAFEDRGPGFAEDLKERIFEPGFTTRSGGPGLGMAVSKKIVEQHGGTIHVTTVTRGGAAFEVSLPFSGKP